MLKHEGVIRDGVVVFDEPLALKDGTRAQFEDVADETPEAIPAATFAERYAEFCGCLPSDTSPELSTQHELDRLGTPKR